MRTPNHRLVARELAIERHARSSEPDQRMEPKGAQRNLVEQTNEIIASSCMGHLVQQDSMELSLIEQSIDTHRKQDNLDRKSTRLNSSHMSISYAVFCLKKKKHTKQPENTYTN